MTTLLRPDADWAAWAREQLELDESATPAEARQAYLRRLRNEDFLPPAHLPYAHAVLERPDRPPGVNQEYVVAEIEERRRSRVEEFARVFFRIPVEERREQWARLKADCRAEPALVERLNRLEPGLNLEPDKVVISNPRVQELMQEISKIFVLRPYDAALERNAFLRREIANSADGMSGWEAAARELKTSHPDYEVLAPGLIHRLMTWRAKDKNLSRKRKKRAAARAKPGMHVSRPAARKQPVGSGNTSGGWTGRFPSWTVYLIVVLGFAVLKAIPGSNSASTSQRTFPTINPTLQRQNIDDLIRSNKSLQEWERNRQDLEKTRQIKEMLDKAKQRPTPPGEKPPDRLPIDKGELQGPPVPAGTPPR